MFVKRKKYGIEGTFNLKGVFKAFLSAVGDLYERIYDKIEDILEKQYEDIVGIPDSWRSDDYGFIRVTEGDYGARIGERYYVVNVKIIERQDGTLDVEIHSHPCDEEEEKYVKSIFAEYS